MTQKAGWLLMGLLVPVAVGGAEAHFNIIVACEMTEAGQKLVHPTPQHPAYYTSYLTGFTDWGKEWGTGDEEKAPLPQNEAVGHWVETTLRAQGYLPAVARTPATLNHTGRTQPPAVVTVAEPSLILNIYWGHIVDPVITPVGILPGNGPGVHSSLPPSHRMLELIGAPDNLASAQFGYSQEAELARYYVIVDAYDYAAYRRSHKKVMLWRTKMSVPSFNQTLGDTLQPMLAAGGPQFGRNLTSPVSIVVSEVPAGHVEVGKPVEVRPQ